MAWIGEHKNVGRWAVLVLLLLAMIGPWAYSADGAPPAEWCHEPFILLENDRCVGLMSGATILTYVAVGFLGMCVGLVTGGTVLAGRAREFLFILSLLLLVLPFISTLLRILDRGRWRQRAFHAVAWGMACLSTLQFVVFSLSHLRVATWRHQLWGLWLYIGLAAGALIVEVLALATWRSPSLG